MIFLPSSLSQRQMIDDSREKKLPPEQRSRDVGRNWFLRVKSGGNVLASRYWPLRDEPSLFCNFCALDLTPENVLNFANHYGWLGIGGGPAQLWWAPVEEEEVTAHRLQAQEKREFDTQPEALPDWHTAQSALRDPLNLWIMIKDRDIEGLSKMFQWSTEWQGWQYRLVGDKCVPVGQAPQLEPNSILPAAAIALQRRINPWLESQTVPRIVYDPDAGTQLLKIVPRNLYGAMWLQLAGAVTGEKEYRACKDKACGQWFEVSPGQRGGTKRKVYCSTTCKVRDFRRSQEESNKRKGKRHVKKKTRSR
jgi:hypothetical protein